MSLNFLSQLSLQVHMTLQELLNAKVSDIITTSLIKDIETLILGCTHYPLVIDEIKKYYGSRVRVIDSPKIVASYLRDILSKNNLLNTQISEGTTQFYLSDLTKNFEKISKKFFGNKISLELKLL